MIAAWMVYCLAVGLALCIAGRAAERALYLARRPTRWAWGAGLLLTLLLPVAALLRPQAFGSITIPLAPPTTVTLNAPTPANAASAADAPQPATGLTWSDIDGFLGWGWGAASAAVLLALAVAGVRLAVLRRRWHAMEVDGRSVLVAENIGPAVTGLWPSRVVIPAWALTLTEQQRRLMLAHEEEHVRSRDPWLLAAGTAVVTAAPWNPALWWLLQRLRHAVEMDCDTRVLRAGHNPLAYGELLLRVGQRRAHLPFAAVAMSEPRSLLELRIRRLSARLPRRRWLSATVSALVAAATFVAACETPRPVNPDRAIVQNAIGTPTATDSFIDNWMRPWVQENLLRYYPDVLHQPNGPPVDVWFGHNARLEVVQVALREGTSGSIGSPQILGVFNNFRPGHDGWGVVDRRALNGLVRDNVRVIWVHLEPQQKRESATRNAVPPYDPDAGYLRLLARAYNPEVFTNPAPQAAIALVFNSQHRVIAHAAGVRVARDSGCLAVAQRLVPAFANAKWSSAGCADGGDPVGRVAVYWISLR